MTDLGELADWLDSPNDIEAVTPQGARAITKASTIIRRLADSRDEGRELGERFNKIITHGDPQQAWDLMVDQNALLTKLLELNGG